MGKIKAKGVSGKMRRQLINQDVKSILSAAFFVRKAFPECCLYCNCLREIVLFRGEEEKNDEVRM
jgi:hypothetical protein